MLSKAENELVSRTDRGTPMGDLWRSFWIPAFLPEEVPTPDCSPVRVRLLGEDLVAFRDSTGKIGLVAANCPHRGASLFFGRNEEEGLRCVYHGWKYNTEGDCIDMPNEPAESNFKHKVHLTAYPCVERGGMVWTYMGPKESTPELPALEWSVVPDDQRYIGKMVVDSNWLQALEGDIDNSHASFLHARLGGAEGEPFRDRIAAGGGTTRGRLVTNPLAIYFAKDTAPRATVVQSDYGIMMGWRREAEEDTYYWQINHWMMPSYALIASPPDYTQLCNTRVPIDDHHSAFYRVRWNPHRPLNEDERAEYIEGGSMYPEMIPGTYHPKENMDNDYQIDRELQRTSTVTGIKSVTQQDRAVTETMGPIYNRTKEHLGTSDTVIIAVRRRLLQLVRALQQGELPYAAQNAEVYSSRPTAILLPKDVPFVEGSKEWVEVGR